MARQVEHFFTGDSAGWLFSGAQYTSTEISLSPNWTVTRIVGGINVVTRSVDEVTQGWGMIVRCAIYIASSPFPDIGDGELNSRQHRRIKYVNTWSPAAAQNADSTGAISYGWDHEEVDVKGDTVVDGTGDDVVVHFQNFSGQNPSSNGAWAVNFMLRILVLEP